MKIIKATNYGFRTVLVVCINPEDPEWVHRVGEPLRDEFGQDLFDDSGEMLTIQATDEPCAETGETCHNCRQNWQRVEVIFDGEEQGETDAEGVLQRHSDADFALLAFARAKASSEPETLSGLVGTRDDA